MKSELPLIFKLLQILYAVAFIVCFIVGGIGLLFAAVSFFMFVGTIIFSTRKKNQYKSYIYWGIPALFVIVLLIIVAFTDEELPGTRGEIQHSSSDIIA